MKTLLSLSLALSLLAPVVALAELTQPKVDELVAEIDERQRNSGDWKAKVVIKQSEKDKEDVVYDAVTFRRDADDKLMILFLQPKSEAGKGYLRIDKNLWFYDPRIGKWERRTERERIGGTGSNRQDFDESRLNEEYDARYIKDDKVGRYDAWVIELTAKSGKDVAYPKLKLWVDQTTHNVLKRYEYAASGKLMRKALYPKWKKMHSESKGGDVWFPESIYIQDQIEKDNKTVIKIGQVDLRSLPANIFTKAWLESKSR